MRPRPDLTAPRHRVRLPGLPLSVSTGSRRRRATACSLKKRRAFPITSPTGHPGRTGPRAGRKDASPTFKEESVQWLRFQLSTTSPRPTRRRTCSTSNTGLNKALTRLSSGFRINISGDDAAGLAVANRYRRTSRSSTRASATPTTVCPTLQIKDGALNNISTLLDRLATLATAGVFDVERRGDIAKSRLGGHDAPRGNRPRSGRRRPRPDAVGFSVFVSNDSGNQTIGGRRRPSARSTSTASPSTRSTWRTPANAQTALGEITAAHRTARRRAEPGRYAAEPPPVRDLAGAVAGGQQEGRREPHPRRQHRGGIGEPDPVQHPDPDRHRGAGAGEPVERLGARAAPVTTWRRVFRPAS